MKTDPLPWTYELTDSMADDDDAFVIQSPERDVAEICSTALTAEGNAALIVRAVNAHAYLDDHPEHHQAREIFADWLEEQGGELSRLGPTDWIEPMRVYVEIDL